MSVIQDLKNKVLQGGEITKKEAIELANIELDELCKAANEIRKHFCGTDFDICTIINGKSGKCSEDCKYCAQSAFYHTNAETYPLLDTEEIVKQAKYNAERGIVRYSIVTSGRKLSNEEVDRMCKTVEAIHQATDVSVCVSFGLLDEAQFKKLKEAGVTRVHNNIETSETNFSNVCTTHTFQDKINAIRAAKRAGLEVCSGGIMGLGETMEDRIEMAFALKELEIRSVPINLLNPIPGTPYEQNEKLTTDDMCRIVALFRFILPKASIRLAGGRGLMPDKGKRCLQSGANAAISGDMLTTVGISIETDMNLLKGLGYHPALCEETK